MILFEAHERDLKFSRRWKFKSRSSALWRSVVLH